MAQRMFNSLSAIFGNGFPNNVNMDNTQHVYGHSGPEMGGTPNHMRSIVALAGAETGRCQSVGQLDHDETSEREDLLDQHVAYFLKHNPEVHSKHSLVRICPGVYNLDGREVSVEWHYADEPGQSGHLIMFDGPLRQPFAEYMQGNETGIVYDETKLGKSAISQIPKGNRLSFGDGNKMYSRLEAMKVAKEQALVREKAADFVKCGMPVPQYELMEKYQKTLSQKLGERRQHQPEAEVQSRMLPAEAPVAVPPPPAAAASRPSPASTSKGKGSKTHGSPKYCSSHNSTEKRQKRKPENLPCSSCQALIQTNYVEFTLCPACSEKDHRCMCCGAAAVGAASSPAPSTPMSARPSPNHGGQTKSPHPSPMSPMNLFGMPTLFNGAAQPQNRSPSQQNPFASSNGYAPQHAMASQNPYASQNAFASYNPLASQRHL